MRLADAIVLNLYNAMATPCVILSATDGEHGIVSPHYSGYATDYRSRSLSEEQKNFLLMKLKGDLPDHFVGSIQHRDHVDEHLCIEYTKDAALFLPALARVPCHPPELI
jgi:hypothetical protein